MERDNIDSFGEYYNRETTLGFRVLGHRDRPDFEIISAVTEQRLGVELTLALFHDDDHLSARKQMHRPDTILPCLELDKMSETELDEVNKKYLGVGHGSTELAEVINDRIQTKINKAVDYHYPHDMLLVIGLPQGPLGKEDIVRFVVPYICVPTGRPFIEIWLNVFCCLQAAENGIIRVG